MATTPLDVAKEAVAEIDNARRNASGDSIPLSELPLFQRIVNSADWADPTFCRGILSAMADFDNLPDSDEELNDFRFTDGVECYCDEYDCICDAVASDLAMECLAVAAERNAAE